MEKWALLVIVLYLLIISAIALVLGLFAVQAPWDVVAIAVPIWVVVMTLCQAGLLVVPVRIESGGPVTRRHLVWPLLVAAVSVAAMAVGMMMALAEFVVNILHYDPGFGWWLLAFGVAAVWMGWAVMFGFYAGSRPPATFMARVARLLIAGSILELLVAVPVHVCARMQNYCCAGYGSVWGLGLGISVMLFAFGPAVFVLFVRRWQSMQARAAKKE